MSGELAKILEYGVGALALGYLGICVLVWLFEPRLVYFPTRAAEGVTPSLRGLSFDDVEIATADGETLAAWWVPADDPDAPVVLFLHGNTGAITGRLDTHEILHGLGVSTLIVDYRGYGRSSGVPSEAGTYEDAAASWRHLTEIRGIAPGRIVLFGRSLGGGIAAWLATRVPARALVLESTFTSLPDVGARVYWWLPVRWISRIQYPTRERLGEVNMPVLIIHSADDELVPIGQGRALYDAAREPRRFLPIKGLHASGFFESGSTYRRGVAEFFREFVFDHGR